MSTSVSVTKADWTHSTYARAHVVRRAENVLHIIANSTGDELEVFTPDQWRHAAQLVDGRELKHYTNEAFNGPQLSEV